MIRLGAVARLALGLALLTAVGALSAVHPFPVRAKSLSQDPGFARPAYALLYDKALARREAGDWQGALRALSRVYQTEVPVQAFYDSLDRTKLEVLSALPGGTRLAAGEQRFTLDELRLHFLEALLARPDVLRHDLRLDTELPLARLLYLYAVTGEARSPSPNEGPVSVAAPRVNLSRALASPDYWLVSAALFLARKGMGRLQPAEVARRWQDRPDLWDQVCTDQALLFLAGRPPSEMAALARIGGDLGDHLSRLRPLPKNSKPRLTALVCRPEEMSPAAADYLAPASCAGLLLRRPGRDEPADTPENCSGGDAALDPGKCSVAYRSGRELGRERSVTLSPGTAVRLVLLVRGGV